MFLVVAFLAVAGNLLHDHPLANFGVGMTVTNVAIALCLDWCVTFHGGRVGRLLNATDTVSIPSAGSVGPLSGPEVTAQ